MKIILISFFLFIMSSNILSQHNLRTSLVDIYMGNYGYWDYQSTGSMQAIEEDSVNSARFSAVYLTADSSLNVPNKRVLYFFSSNTGQTWVSATVANIESSYPSLALQTDGRAIVCFYDSINTRIRIYRNQSAGSLTFDSFPSPPSNTGTNPKILYYRNYLVLCSVLPGGQVQKTRYNFTTNTWESWQQISAGINGAAYQIAKGYGGKISLSWIGDAPANNVKYSESVDSGNTFGAANTIFSNQIAGSDTLRAFTHIDMVYYNNQPAITWDANAGISPLTGQPGIRKLYKNPRIYFWNTQYGLQLVADSSNYGGFSLPGRNFTISMGYNFSTLGAPSIGVSTSFGISYIYISYSAAKSNTPFGNSWYDSDVFTKFSTSGNFWSTLFNGIPADNTYDDRFVCMAKYAYPSFGNSIGLIIQKDNFPGSFRAGDTNSITQAHPEFFYLFITTHIVEENEHPTEFDLCQNYPNPFNSSTKIDYYLPRRAFVKIEIIDAIGRDVETLVNDESSAGLSSTIFEGKNFASGLYFYRMWVDGKVYQTQKMVLLK